MLSLDTLGFDCPPLISSRDHLLSLSVSDLRTEVIRSLKFSRIWRAEGGPSSTFSAEIKTEGKTDRDVYIFVPEGDVIITSSCYPLCVEQVWGIREHGLLCQCDLNAFLNYEIEPALGGIRTSINYEFIPEQSSIIIVLCLNIAQG